MASYDSTSPDRSDRAYEGLEEWERLVVDAVGRVIDFWGFKRNQGRIWALLYLRGEPMTSTDLEEDLEVSKGTVSMATRELEKWDVIRRESVVGSAANHFVAESDFLTMIRNVVRDREQSLVERVRDDLREAARRAREAGADDEAVERIERMERLAEIVVEALDLFLESARMEVTDAEDVL